MLSTRENGKLQNAVLGTIPAPKWPKRILLANAAFHNSSRVRQVPFAGFHAKVSVRVLENPATIRDIVT